MGTIISKDTRRISFNNTIELDCPLNIEKSLTEDDILEIENIDLKPINESHNDTVRSNEKDYWAQRIEYLKQEHQLINKIIESEYEKTLENTRKLFDAPKISQDRKHKIKPCFEWRHKILQCYEDNPRQPLACSSLVQEFSSCVSACSIED